MSLNDAMLMVIGHARGQTLKLVADLTDEQLAVQPAAKMNHAAWVLGHLLVVDYGFRQLVTGEPAPEWVTEEVRAIYGNKSEPVADKGKYKPKAFYIEKMAEVRGQIMARLKVMTAAEFDAPHPDPARRERFPTVGHMAMFYGTWHETYHSGQLSAWRRVQGLPAV